MGTKAPVESETTKAPVEPATTEAPVEDTTTELPVEPATTKAPVEPATTKAPASTTKSPPSGNCVSSCAGMADGDYQACDTCDGFIKCSNERLFYFECAQA